MNSWKKGQIIRSFFYLEFQRRQEPAAQPTTGSPVLANKYRILLCAPSNAAIDELIGQIKRARIRLDKKQDNKENWRRNQQSAFQKG